MYLTAPQLIWSESGKPFIETIGKSNAVNPETETACAICNVTIKRKEWAHLAKPVTRIPSYSRHADFLKWPSEYLCMACSWFHSNTTQKHRNVLAIQGHGTHWPTLTTEQEGRHTWKSALQWLLEIDGDTIMTGLCTTDIKPRFWPSCRLGTARNPVIYMHTNFGWSAPLYILSVDIKTILERYVPLIEECTRLGFTKKAIWQGLMLAPNICKKDTRFSINTEYLMTNYRQDPNFRMALAISKPKNI